MSDKLNMLLSQIDLPGVNLKVRDHREWMNESLDKRAEHLARVEIAARSNHQVEVNEEDSNAKFYSRGNKVD